MKLQEIYIHTPIILDIAEESFRPLNLFYMLLQFVFWDYSLIVLIYSVNFAVQPLTSH